MSEDTGQQTRPAGRSIQVLAFGDDADGIEMDALDKARGFFGADLRIQIVPHYRVFANDGALAAEAPGKLYHASVTVQVIER